MPKLNKNLVRSVVQDLKNLEKMCNILFESVHNVQCESWRYPNQKCQSVQVSSILGQFKGTSYECYLLILELMYDRFQYYLNLMVKYLDTIPLISEEFNLPQNVKYPGILSTGALLKMLWTRIELIHHYILQILIKDKRHLIKGNELNTTFSFGALLSQNVSSPKNHQLYSFSRSTQTEQCSLIKCESCSISEEMLKFILKEIKTKFPENKIQVSSTDESLALNIKREVEDITQWGAMTKWSEMTKKDVSHILQTINKQMQQNDTMKRYLHHQEEKIKQEIPAREDEIERLEKLVISLHAQRATDQELLRSLKEEKETLTLETKQLNEKIQKEESKLKLKEKELQNSIEKNAAMELELTKLVHEMGLKDIKLNYAEIREEWKKIVSSNEREKSDLQLQLKEVQTTLQAKEEFCKAEIEKRDVTIKNEREKQNELISKLKTVKDYIHKTEHAKDQLQSNLNDAELKVNTLTTTNENLQKELQQKKEREKLLLEYPDTNVQIQVEVQGNPVHDIENQIKANKIRVQLLSEQTKRLDVTLHKLRRLTKEQK